MALTTYSGRDFKFGFIEQTGWGTAMADSSNCTMIHADAIEVDEGVNVIERSIAIGSRLPSTDESITHTNQCLSRITIPSIAAKHDELDHYLYGLFQSVVESTAAVFDKTFTLSTTSAPDFTSNAGYFQTFFIKDPIAGKSLKFKDVVTESITLSCAPGEPLMVGATLVSRGVPVHNSTPSGTFTAASNDFWYYADIATATYNFASALDLNLEGAWELTLSRPVTGVGQSSGDYYTLIHGAPEFTFKISAMHGALTDTARTAVQAATAGSFRIGWGNATAGTVDGDLDFAFDGTLNRDGVKVLGTDGPVALVELSGTMRKAAGANPITVVIANSNDRTW